jgi:hypothetical protein
LVVDAVKGVEMLGTEFFADDDEFAFFAHSAVTQKNHGIMDLPLNDVPGKVRVVWRKTYDWGPSWWSSPTYADDYGKSLENHIPPDSKPNLESFLLGRKEKIERRKKNCC